MPRAKQQDKVTSKSQADVVLPRRARPEDEWGGFVPLNLSESDREEFSEWWADNPLTVREGLDDAIGSGLKFTVSYDGRSLCYIASFTGRPDLLGSHSFTCCLSARSATFDEAVALLVYKHTALLQYDWWELVNQPKGHRSTFG